MSVAYSIERARGFFAAELGSNPGRLRAFLRLETALVLAAFVVITFTPTNAYWTIVYLMLVCAPTVGNSMPNAIARFNWSVVGCGAAFVLIIAAYDEPWLYLPLQAALLGVALFIGRSTPIGPIALTGGATFAIISGSDVTQLPGNLISLGFYRVLQAAIGGGIGVFAQLVFWPDDPLVWLRRSLAAQLREIERGRDGSPVLLDPSRVGRHLELMDNAQMRDATIVHRRSEILALVLDVGCLVDEALREHRRGRGVARATLAVRAAQLREQLLAPALFTPPPSLPPGPGAPSREMVREALRETLRPARRAALKMALSTLVAAAVTQLLGFPSAGALFAGLTVSLQVSSGTSIAKSLLIVAGPVLALVVLMLVITPLMPNLEDPGSFLVLAAIAYAPTAWMAIGGPRVRNAGLFGTAIVSVSLFEDFRPAIDLQQPAVFALTIAIGALVVGAVDRLVWPVDARAGMFVRAALIMRETAELYREPDARIVLLPNRGARWRLHRHLVALVQLRGERVPLPGNPCFAPEEEVLRLAASTQRLVVARIEQARDELLHGTTPGATAARVAVAARLDERARAVEKGHHDVAPLQ